jgi:hypothetical protein
MATNAQYLASLVNSSGNINIPVSNAGINFNNSSAIGASTLTDYETGTFTPNITGGSGGAISGGSFSGQYIKIGQLVYVSLIIGSWTKNTLSGFLQIGNLPFTASGTTGITQQNSNGAIRFDNNGVAITSTTQLVPQIASGLTFFTIQKFNAGYYAGTLAASDLNSGTLSIYSLTATYQANF